MALRLPAPGLAALVLVLWLAGADGPASLALLAAIVAGAARLLAAVGDTVDGRTDRFPVVMAACGLVSLVAAGAAHVPLLALGVFACLCLELLGGRDVPAGVASGVPVELAEQPISRAA